jgi:predicted O-methyltransferase YrrM
MFIHERSQFQLPSLLDFDDETQEEILQSEDFFRFTVVRNPFTRLQSAWQDKIRLCAPRYEGMYYALRGRLPTGRDPDSIISFEEFVQAISHDSLTTCDHHWRLQTAHLFYPALRFSLVGHLEEFNRAIRAFVTHLGKCSHELPNMNEANQSPALFSESLAHQVYMLYKPDFDAFAYPEDSWPRPRHEQAVARTVSEARYLDEVIERNIVIGFLYEERARLTERLSVKQAACYEQYKTTPFDQLFKEYIAATEGWLDVSEAELLYELAKSVRTGCIVEVGSYRGRSTTALALGSLAGNQVPVYSIDPHETFVGPFGGKFGPIDRGYYMQRMVELGLFHIVHLINLSSDYLTGGWPMPVDLLWIDGDHSYDAVARDFRVWASRLSNGGHLVFDDASGPETGPGRLAQEIAASGGFVIVESRGKVVWLQKCGSG